MLSEKNRTNNYWVDKQNQSFMIIPEPTTLGLAILGCLLMIAWSKYRTK